MTLLSQYLRYKGYIFTECSLPYEGGLFVEYFSLVFTERASHTHTHTHIYIYIYLFKKKIEMLCNLINIFTVAFDQFNASLLNKSINLFLKSVFNIVLLFIWKNIVVK